MIVIHAISEERVALGQGSSCLPRPRGASWLKCLADEMVCLVSVGFLMGCVQGG